jgi:hypothetical protein
VLSGRVNAFESLSMLCARDGGAAQWHVRLSVDGGYEFRRQLLADLPGQCAPGRLPGEQPAILQQLPARAKRAAGMLSARHRIGPRCDLHVLSVWTGRDPGRLLSGKSSDHQRRLLPGKYACERRVVLRR